MIFFHVVSQINLIYGTVYRNTKTMVAVKTLKREEILVLLGVALARRDGLWS